MRGFILFVFKPKTAYEVRISDWSSDVCSSDRDALQRTLDEGRMVYWSRSRQEQWRKGDTSGHVQHWEELRADCDGDVVLARVHQERSEERREGKECGSKWRSGWAPDH